MLKLAPIALFLYNRPEHTKQVLDALARNNEAHLSKIFVFCDGPKINASAKEVDKIDQVHDMIESNPWNFDFIIEKHSQNMGLAKSIVNGISKIIKKYGRIIVLEDDIVVSPFFLGYMNHALNTYKNKVNVMSICGFSELTKVDKLEETFFMYPWSCWGWATWSDRWEKYNDSISYVENKIRAKEIKKFNVNHKRNLYWKQIEMNKSREINTWAIFWYATIFINKGLCLYPKKSLVQNIGFDGSGINCSGYDKFKIHPFEQEKIKYFESNIQNNEFAINSFREQLRKPLFPNVYKKCKSITTFFNSIFIQKRP